MNGKSYGLCARAQGVFATKTWKSFTLPSASCRQRRRFSAACSFSRRRIGRRIHLCLLWPGLDSNTMAKPALGTGLSALIGAAGKRPVKVSLSAPTPLDQVLRVPLDRISPSPLQPRRDFSDAQLDELVESIREHGVIQPLIVREVEDRLELIAGERRLRACLRLGLPDAPVIVRQATDRDVLEMALIENLQREDLNPIEEAQAYRRLAGEFKLRQEDIARKVGRSRASVANSMRLLDLAAQVQTHLAQGRLSVGHAKVLLGIKDQAAQCAAADRVVRQGLTVRATEQAVQKILRPPAAENARKSPSSQLPAAVAAVENLLRDHFATHVGIRHGERKGRIEIEYYGQDDLQRILDLLGLEWEDS
ncbi:MAG TPA: ParB/RepB/Spo0J family partition protein [Verrucomicrobiales bacterium]|nr:ParB/RepB/Spo0J family partition protein [Verrucomicrobiales bacterium]